MLVVKRHIANQLQRCHQKAGVRTFRLDIALRIRLVFVWQKIHPTCKYIVFQPHWSAQEDIGTEEGYRLTAPADVQVQMPVNMCRRLCRIALQAWVLTARNDHLHRQVVGSKQLCRVVSMPHTLLEPWTLTRGRTDRLTHCACQGGRLCGDDRMGLCCAQNLPQGGACLYLDLCHPDISFRELCSPALEC